MQYRERRHYRKLLLEPFSAFPVWKSLPESEAGLNICIRKIRSGLRLDTCVFGNLANDP